ncbi:P22 phage major capsid protein family protein [Saccharothrix mutabilis subsp. capreolus]|uniref:P22 phage major capsid protein family protein n=1 Tax=Saccharothrix mutabilis TaxID=33921 RepID=UPI0035F03A23
MASASLAALEAQTVLAATTWRDAEADFRGKQGSVVTVHTDTIVGEAREFDRAAGQPIVVDDVQEIGVDVKLDKYLYKGVNLPDEQLTLNVRDFTRQIATPQAKSVARRIETLVAAQMNALPSTLTMKPDGSDVHAVMIEARARLNKAGVPLDDRFFAVSTEVESLLLNDPLKRLIPVDASGSPAALREAIIGRLYGFTVLPSNYLADRSAVAYHRSGFPLVTRSLEVPAGATFGQSITYNGFALRLVRDYDPAFQQDRSVVSTLAGADVTKDDGQVKRALRLTIAPAA